jgi:hypothetical protein
MRDAEILHQLAAREKSAKTWNTTKAFVKLLESARGVDLTDLPSAGDEQSRVLIAWAVAVSCRLSIHSGVAFFW